MYHKLLQNLVSDISDLNNLHYSVKHKMCHRHLRCILSFYLRAIVQYSGILNDEASILNHPNNDVL